MTESLRGEPLALSIEEWIIRRGLLFVVLGLDLLLLLEYWLG